MSASQKKPWKRFIDRDKVQGGGGGKDRRSSRSNNVAALVGRLRRLEVVVLVLSMKMKLGPRALDNLLEEMLALADVEEPRSGGPDERREVPVPHSGTVDGSPEREADSSE